MTASAYSWEYVLGTDEEEAWRLGLQHRVWRSRALDAWRRAGFTLGQTLLDVGCGPGHASFDLADIVGPSGKVVAVDGSQRFLAALEATRARRGVENIATTELDLDESALPVGNADGAWGRWVFSFVRHPRRVLDHVRDALRPGGVLVLHEYFNYASWRITPRSAELEEFVAAVMKSWRADGGEPDIALPLLTWLPDAGFEIQSIQPLVDVVRPSSFTWQWPRTFVRSGLRRLVELGFLSSAQAARITQSVTEAEANPNAFMVTPAVLEIIAVRR